VYPIDVIDRPTLDAVAVCLWSRGPEGVEVLTRSGLRPAAAFRRGRRTVVAEPRYLLLEEIVAGVLEPGEVGVEALCRRGAEEVREETGIEIPAERLSLLGGALFMLPGIVSEKIHLVEGEVPRGAGPPSWPAPSVGDGSPLEEGAELRWRLLARAVAACERGEIEDAKSEVAFRRLASRLGAAIR
jgi:ADP-ribose pyrophosphatase